MSILNNTADKGGGICIFSYYPLTDLAFNMTDNVKIKYNTATAYGGIYIGLYNKSKSIGTLLIDSTVDISDNLPIGAQMN